MLLSKSFFVLIIPTLGTLLSCQSNPEKLQTHADATRPTDSVLFGKGDKVPNDKFVGNVYQHIISKPNSLVSNVTFEAGGRTNWHYHPGGQVLMVTAGVGYYQEEGGLIRKIRTGDIVHIEPNLLHWHGASADSAMTHIAVSIDHEANPSVWADPVSEEQYNTYQSEKQ